MAHLPFTEDAYLPEAFEQRDDKLCVPRQIARLTRTTVEPVVEKFNDIIGNSDWQQQGLHAEQTKEFARFTGCPFFFIGNNNLLSLYEPIQKVNRALVCVAYDGHAFFMKSARLVSNWTLRDGITLQERTVLQHEIKSQLPPLSEWREWKGEPSPAHFWTRESLQKVRVSLLKSGRNPRIILKGMTGIPAIRYHCVMKKDNSSGMCVIRQLPAEAQQIRDWLEKLPVDVQ